MIPLHDEMIISFVNYELKVSLLQKTAEEIKEQQAGMNDFFAKLGQSAPSPAPVRSTPADSQPSEPKYTAEVQPNVAPEQPPAEDGAAAEDVSKPDESKPEAAADE
jgi:hypothetical protein